MRDAIHHAIDIDAAPDEVWRIFAALDGWPSWFPYAAAARSSDAAPLATVGGRVEVELRVPVKGRLRLALEVVEADPPRQVRWIGSAPGVRADHRFDFEARGDGARRWTRVTSHATFGGALALLLRRAVRERLDDASHDALARLRDLVTARLAAAGAVPR